MIFLRRKAERGPRRKNMVKGVRTGVKGSVRALVPERAMTILTTAEKGELDKDHSVPMGVCGGVGFEVVEGFLRYVGVEGLSVEIFMVL